jgi:hypothetical protein
MVLKGCANSSPCARQPRGKPPRTAEAAVWSFLRIEEVMMKKMLRMAFAASMVTSMLLGAAVAEPAPQSEMALMGPDRSPRAPERAVTAPTRRTEAVRREETVVAPPAVTESFVYKKTECKTLTDAPFDIWGHQHRCVDGPAIYVFDEDRVHAWSPTDEYLVNRLGAMGADREFMRVDECQRLGVWANGRIAGTAPTTIVSEMTARMSALTCGEWTSPYELNIAGVPVTAAHGWDVFGNYYYEVYAFERFGNTYAFASRRPYKSRYDVDANTDLAFLITHIHPSVWVE